MLIAFHKSRRNDLTGQLPICAEINFQDAIWWPKLEWPGFQSFEPAKFSRPVRNISVPSVFWDLVKPTPKRSQKTRKKKFPTANDEKAGQDFFIRYHLSGHECPDTKKINFFGKGCKCSPDTLTPDCRMDIHSSFKTVPNSVGGIHKKTAAQHFRQLSFYVTRVWRCCARQTYRKTVGKILSRQSVKGYETFRLPSPYVQSGLPFDVRKRAYIGWVNGASYFGKRWDINLNMVLLQINRNKLLHISFKLTIIWKCNHTLQIHIHDMYTNWSLPHWQEMV